MSNAKKLGVDSNGVTNVSSVIPSVAEPESAAHSHSETLNQITNSPTPCNSDVTNVIPDAENQPNLKKPHLESAQTHNQSEKQEHPTAQPVPQQTGFYLFHITDIDERLKAEGYYPGVWWVEQKDEAVKKKWVCSPINVEAITRDHQDNNYGRLLSFVTVTNKRKQWTMPMELLAGGGEPVRAMLLSMGLNIDYTQRNQLSNYLQSQRPQREITCATQTGWHGSNYVFPDVVLGPDAKNLVFQATDVSQSDYGTQGSAAQWKDSIAAYAIQNSALQLALCAAFAGPLLDPLNLESGGIHFNGSSSSGKSTLQKAAASVYGPPGYRRSWRSTTNGLEAIAVQFNDCLLVLDEIQQADPKEVGAMVYSLGNGQGKARASRTGAARPLTRWRCSVISSGEEPLEQVIARSGQQVKAGQGVRLLNIQAHNKHGVFDDLGEFTHGSQLSDHLNNRAKQCYGVVGREFVKRLTGKLGDLRGRHTENLKMFTATTGQEARVAGRFACYLLAGQLATEFGLTGWEAKSIEKTILGAFNEWKSNRGDAVTEEEQAIQAIANFLDIHGSSRFEDANAPPVGTYNRAGWYEVVAGERVYYLSASAMTKEVCAKIEKNQALAFMGKHGILINGKDGKPYTTKQIQGSARKVYKINPSAIVPANESQEPIQ